MFTQSIIKVVTIFSIIVFYFNYSSNDSIDFEFDVKNLDNNQRNRLFDHLDKNKDNLLSKTEFKRLLRQLFYSFKQNRTLVNDSNEEKIFDALNLNFFSKQLGRDEFNKLWSSWIVVILKPKSALIVVDVQNDFMEAPPKGSLTVTNGTVIVPVINELISSSQFDLVVYTYDWHPSNHCSFVESARNGSIDRKIVNMSKKSISDLKKGDIVYYENNPDVAQKLWPKHCVQNTLGAELYKNLLITQNNIKIAKGTDPDIDSYSAFQDNKGLHKTTLDLNLQQRGITDVYLSGVLYEFCVGRTALDALKLGYRTAFIENAIQTEDPKARDEMRQTLINESANIIQSDDVSDMVRGRERTVQMGIVLAKKLFRKH